MNDLSVLHTNSPRADEILHSMLAPGMNSVFVLGSFEKRITLYHQQVRALNLAFALHRLGYCHPSVRIAVVGAGAAGLTVAAALSLCSNCEVELFEREDYILSVLDQNGKRFLSPVLYEWPGVKEGGESFDRFGRSTPMTGWRPGPQRDVVKWFKEEWPQYRRKDGNGRVTEHFNVIGLSLSTQPPLREKSQSSSKLWLAWNTIGSPGLADPAPFDIVILAMGFGLETTIPPLPLRSYWQDDPKLEGLTAGQSLLVSGAGDGGWTDIFHAVLPHFHQTKITSEYLARRFVPWQARDRLLQIEADAIKEQRLGRNPAGMLTEEYDKINSDDLENHLREEYKRGSQPKVFLNAPINYVNGDCFLANRFLGSRLVKAGVVTHWAGRVVDIRQLADQQYFVVLEDGSTQTFDHVVLRHGVEPALRRFDPAFFVQCEPALRKVALLDRTTIPAWPPAYFEQQMRSEVSGQTFTQDRVETLDTIENYCLAVRNQAGGTLSSGELLAAAAPAFPGVPGSTTDPLDFEAVLDNGQCTVIRDDNDGELVDAWVGAVAAYSRLEPARLGLQRPYVPIILTPNNVASSREKAGAAAGFFETLRFIVYEECGIPVRPDQLRKWPSQAEYFFLVIFRGDRRMWDRDEENVAWLLDELGREVNVRVVVLRESGFWSPRTSRGPAKLYRFKLTPGNPWEKMTAHLDGDTRTALLKFLESVFAGEISWTLVELVVSIFTSDLLAACKTPKDFGDFCLRHASAHCEDGGDLVMKALPAIGYYVARYSRGASSSNPGRAVPRSDVVAFIADSHRESKESVGRMINELVRLGRLRETRSTATFDTRGPALAVVDDFFRTYLAGIYLAGHTPDLAECVQRPSQPRTLHAPVLFALQLVPDHANEMIEPLLANLAPHNVQFLAETIAAGVGINAENRNAILDVLLESITNFGGTSFNWLNRLGLQETRVLDKLQAIINDPDVPRQWSKIAAATAVFGANKSPAALDCMLKFATNADIEFPLRLRAIDALRDVGETGHACAAALAYAEAANSNEQRRVTAAEKGAAMCDQRCVDWLRKTAWDGQFSEQARVRAAWALERTGERDEAIQIWWELLENGNEQSSRRSGLQSLIGSGAQLSDRERMSKCLERIAQDDAPENRWWAIQELDRIGVTEMAVNLTRRLADDPKVEDEILLAASGRLVGVPEQRHAALEIIRTMACQRSLPSAIRVKAARTLHSFLGANVSGDVRAAMAELSDDREATSADRVDAAAAWGEFESADAAVEAVIRLCLDPDEELWLDCGKKLGELGALSYARQALMKVITEGHDPNASKHALWALGLQKQFDAMLAACRFGQIPQTLWPEVNDVFGELRHGVRPLDLTPRDDGNAAE